MIRAPRIRSARYAALVGLAPVLFDSLLIVSAAFCVYEHRWWVATLNVLVFLWRRDPRV